MKPNEPSWLHRKLGLELGRAPAWLIARSDCTGVDVFGIAFFALFFGGVYVLFTVGLVGMLLIKTAFAIFWVWTPAEHCERFSRARIRRGECVRCGAKGEAITGDRCENCSRGR